MELSVVVFALIFGLCNAVLNKSQLVLDNVITPPCNALVKCSYAGDPVWASDGKSCYIFRNQCLLRIENCRRQKNNETYLEGIPKAKCQGLCSSKCVTFTEPVCGSYNGDLVQFPSLCWMEFYICKTGETFTMSNEGLCP